MKALTIAAATLEGHREWEWMPTGWDGADLRSLGNVAIEVSVSGRAAAAGLSLGDYRDLLVPVHGDRFLQLDVDWHARQWRFRDEGRIVPPQWWNAGLRSPDDFPNAPLLFKAHHPHGVVFRDFGVRQLESSCRLSVILTCYRFARRLRVSLRAWCSQTLPAGALEIIVVNPSSPDDTHDVVRRAAREHPHVRVRELTAPGALARNKGRLINQAVGASHGEWIWLTDADCLFQRGAAAEALAEADSRRKLLYCERRHLTEAATGAVLDGRIDPVAQFAALSADTRADTNVVPWGYCQIFHRSLFECARYREDVDAFSASDVSFAEACAAAGVMPVRLYGVTCLHLVHPWAWLGTTHFL